MTTTANHPAITKAQEMLKEYHGLSGETVEERALLRYLKHLTAGAEAQQAQLNEAQRIVEISTRDLTRSAEDILGSIELLNRIKAARV